jgi:uncharacterized membrane protein
MPTNSTAIASDAPLSSAKSRVRSEAEERDYSALSGRTFTINRPRSELYAFWRDFANLPRFMENIESVSVLDGERSHWKVAAPGGELVEWDAIITEDKADELIAWRSADGADISNSGRVQFRDAAPGRGTEVTATIAYNPPAGPIGKLLAKLFQREPSIQARRELRRFKQLMETGEVSTSEPPKAAPRAE